MEMVKLKPEVDREFAADLAHRISKYARQFKYDPTLSVAIAMQESSFKNKNRVNRRGRITDVGVFQLHVKTITNLQIDIDRLKRDVDYQTFWHAKILSDKIRTCKNRRSALRVKVGNEWSCYHSFTYAKRRVYLEDVSSHLVKLRMP